MNETTYETFLDTPAGRLRLTASGQALTRVSFVAADDSGGSKLGEGDVAHGILGHARRELLEYFEGARTSFTVPVRLDGTPFQREVWEALEDIPFGQTRCYGDIACALGRPSAARAVGAANGQNPIAIIVPCHRVVGADGSLTGYAGGLEPKRRLLAHERPSPSNQQTSLLDLVR